MEGPFLRRAPSAETRGEGGTPSRGTEAHLETLAVSADPVPRDAVTRIPAGLSLGRWGGTRCSHVTPRGVQLHLPGLHPFPPSSEAPPPGLRHLPQPAHGRDGRAT